MKTSDCGSRTANHFRTIRFLLASVLVCLPIRGLSAPANVSFAQSGSRIDAYDYVEITATIEKPDAKNPFTDASLTGTFQTADGNKGWKIEGFCDSPDGSIFRIRFMPEQPGKYTFQLNYKQSDWQMPFKGSLEVTGGHRRGTVAVDPEYPWHFIWSGSKEHFFFNGTTAYFLVGWRDDRVINDSIERLHKLKVNRMRVLLEGAGATLGGLEPVDTGENFTMMLRPWLAKAPNSFENPCIDFTRFDVPYWQKWERMLRSARDRDMNISVVFYWELDREPTSPKFAGSEDERRYFRYAVARLSAFSNVTWDLGDDLDSYRDEKWAHEMGNQLMNWDPYHHLATSHPTHPGNQDRASPWFSFTSIQEWSRRQHQIMLEQRELQVKTGRIIPQTNEEYGYEDHYPKWGPEPPGDDTDVLRRVAWDIAMAGAYGTAGETVHRGVNYWPDTGGGWLNGRGDDSMIMLKGYEHMVDFFTSFEWWKTEPHDELINNGAYCLAKPGEIYAVYLPLRGQCGRAENLHHDTECGAYKLQLAPGVYDGTWFRAATGETIPIPSIQGPEWTLPPTPGWGDWALLLKRR